ncbi:winged helix-turn-helix transcriptional regulator [Mycobacterium shigaense]|uniref:ArsR family transcriptional regulator n=1 Tax=Mycobacterium shigaense TaxID=722731 RepID=A0A1Z4ECE1_9MYCO|nr:helix-turn-helix domain-containing protein [Mycobacterium shigaense]MEA1122508.1 helix-turn-helix domain-containing protein [Mycobacterium shigaense]PRI17159.1 ArsR family transcriptional regulator [Mycobacterium shigaense]BAX90616.1 ArsR family transcriptional regulator [Mycobacterium shigaense]
MALPREYPDENCPIARSLEIVGERWTLLIVRDTFYGARRFSDFHHHLGVPKAVLADRLAFLVAEGVLAKEGSEYRLTAKGLQLWPLIWSMITWGKQHLLNQPTRTYRHAGCGGSIDSNRTCQRCAQVPEVGELVVHPPRRPHDPRRDDPVSRALARPHRMLEQI